MTATTPAAPAIPIAATNSIDLGAILSNAVDSAKVSMTTVWSSIAGMFSTAGVGGTFVVKILQTLDPSFSTYATAGLAMLATIIGVVAQGYHLATHLNATNNSTVALSEKWLNGLQVFLGITPTDFTAANNGGSLPTATA